MSEVMKFHLEYFDGPLDLLLHLIKDSKLDVENVFLSDVTEQFLEYMKELDRLDMETASEFLSVASTLLEIKSKALLPRYEENNDDFEDDGAMLLRKLEEYKLIKEVSKDLKELEDVKKFYRESDPKAFIKKVVFKESDIDQLLSAFTKMMLMAGDEDTRQKMVARVIPKDAVSVQEQSEKLLEILKIKKVTTFFQLFSVNATKMEIVVTLMAILELIKNQLVRISQSKEFEDISIELAEGDVE